MQLIKKKSERKKREQLRVCVEKFALRLLRYCDESNNRFVLNLFRISRADASSNKIYRLKQRVCVLMSTNAIKAFNHLSPRD